ANRTQSSYPLAPPPLPGGIQAKLAIGPVDDPLEHEADRVADLVMRMPHPALSISAAPPPAASEVPPIVHEVLRSPGQPLDAATRAFFEPRFERDFTGIHVHADARAAKAVAALDARAFAAGPHLVIDPAEYGGDRGRRLIAHELAHTVQQRGF